MRRLLIFAAVVMMIMAMAAPASAKITVCHVTHSAHTPVVEISVGDAAWNNGHDDAGTDVRPAKHQREDWNRGEGDCEFEGG
jgi:hypothetical protein